MINGLVTVRASAISAYRREHSHAYSRTISKVATQLNAGAFAYPSVSCFSAKICKGVPSRWAPRGTISGQVRVASLAWLSRIERGIQISDQDGADPGEEKEECQDSQVAASPKQTSRLLGEGSVAQPHTVQPEVAVETDAGEVAKDVHDTCTAC